jgi:hypothetical protein
VPSIENARMPSLLTCAGIAEDLYHDRPTAVDWHQPVRVPDQDVYCAGHEFAGGAQAGNDGVGVIAFRGSREMEDWMGANLEIIRRLIAERQLGSALAFFASACRPRDDFPQTAPTMVRSRCPLGGWQGWAWRRRACRSGACGCRDTTE